jgi:hypothetical protein
VRGVESKPVDPARIKPRLIMCGARYTFAAFRSGEDHLHAAMDRRLKLRSHDLVVPTGASERPHGQAECICSL